VLKLIATASAGVTKAIFDGASTALVLGLVAAMSLYIIVKMVQGAKQELASKKR